MGIDPSKTSPAFRAKLTGYSDSLAQTEADHQNRFISICKERGWAYVWHSTKKRSTGTIGTPDAIVVAHGKVFWIEFKLPGQFLSPDQQVFARLLAQNGAQLHVVYSAEEALALIECQIPREALV